MKNKFNKLIYTLFVVLAFLPNSVKALNEYTLNNVEEGNKISFESIVSDPIVITASSEDGVYVSSCNWSTGVKAVYNEENKSCTVTPISYGYSYFALELKESNGNYLTSAFINIDVDGDNYFDTVFNRIPSVLKSGENLYSYIPNGFSADYLEANQAKIIYSYDIFENGSPVNKKIDRIKNYSYENNSNSKFSGSNSVILAQNSKNYQTYINYQGDIKDLTYIVENSNIASVTQSGKLTAKTAGETQLGVFNLNNMDNYKMNLLIQNNPFNKISDYIDSVSNKTYAIYNEYATYNDSSVSLWKVVDYFNKDIKEKVDSKYSPYIDQGNSICINDVCTLRVNYYTNGNYNTATISNVRIETRVLTTENSTYRYYLGSEVENTGNTIRFRAYLSETDDFTLVYDNEYINVDEFNKDGRTIKFTGLKEGVTTLTIVSNEGFEKKVAIFITKQNYFDEISTAVGSRIELPYKFSSNDSESLKYLEKIVSDKVLSNLSTIAYKDSFTINTVCYTSEYCTANLKITDDNNNNLHNGKYNIGIKYSDAATLDISKLNEITSTIDDKYVLKADKLIKYIRQQDPEENDYYDTLYTLTNINSIINNEDFTVNIVNQDMVSEFGNHIFSVNFDVEILFNSNIVYTKNVTMYGSTIVNVPFSVQNEDAAKLNYVTDYAKDLLGDGISVSKNGENIYTISNLGRELDVLLVLEEKISISSIYPEKNIYELGVGESDDIEYNFYPNNANYGTVKFESLDPSIVTVDDDGNMNAVKKGYTFIKVFYTYSSYYILVTVDTEIEEALNEFLPEDNTTYTIFYDNLRLSSLEESIKSKVSEERYYRGLPNIYSIDYVVEEDNEKYYVKTRFTDGSVYPNEYYYSDSKEVKYKLEGINIKDEDLEMSVGETKKLDIEFSEGDINNLYFTSENPNVAKVNKKGEITALKPGKVLVDVSDKYYNYFNYIYVYVDFDEYYNEQIDALKNEVIELNMEKAFNVESAFGDYIRENLLNPNNMYYENETYTCNLENDQNTCTYKGKINGVEAINETFNIKLVGIKINDYYYYEKINLNVGGIYEIDTEIYDSNKNLTYISSDNQICTVDSSGKVTAVKKGVCDIKVTNTVNSAYINFVVAQDELLGTVYDKLNAIDEPIIIKAHAYTSVDDLSTDEKDSYLNDISYVALAAIADEIGERNILTEGWEYDPNVLEFEIGYEWDDIETIITEQSMTVYVNGFFRGVRSDDKHEFDISFNNREDFEPVKIYFEFEELSEEQNELIDKISNLDTHYDITLEQYLKYEIDNKNSEEFKLLTDYTTFREDIKKICPACTLFMIGAGGGGEAGRLSEGADYMVFENGYYLCRLSVGATAEFGIMIDKYNTTEEEYIELLKEEVKKAYLKAKEETESSGIVNSVRSFISGIFKSSSEEPEVEVTKEFDIDLNKNIYIFKIEDIEFKTSIDVSLGGDAKYTYSVTGITSNKNTLELDPGDEETIEITVSPSNATNKKYNAVSSNENVVTVENNKIKAVSSGNAYVVFVTEDGDFETAISVKVSGETLKTGDVNLDSKVDLLDLIKLRKHLAELEILKDNGLKNADINKDSKVDILDLIKLRKQLAEVED